MWPARAYAPECWWRCWWARFAVQSIGALTGGGAAGIEQSAVGRGDAQATCLALRIDADGEATLTNAGHLPPYLNGEPLAMEGALPLGMLAGQSSL